MDSNSDIPQTWTGITSEAGEIGRSLEYIRNTRKGEKQETRNITDSNSGGLRGRRQAR